MKTLDMLYIVLKELNYDFKKFDSDKVYRIIFQKLVYVLQTVGFNYGYRYNLYINGPYSPELARDGYQLIDMYDEIEAAPQFKGLTSSGMAKLEKAKEFLDYRLDDPNWLELITTLHFIFSETFNKDIRRKKSIIAKFKEIKPHLANRDEEIEIAWTKIATLS